MGYSFIPVNTAFRCYISLCNNIVVEQTVLARFSRFLSVPIFHSIGACGFQLVYKSVLALFLFDLKLGMTSFLGKLFVCSFLIQK